jgi:hypothetical protein
MRESDLENIGVYAAVLKKRFKPMDLVATALLKWVNFIPSLYVIFGSLYRTVK